MERKAVKAWAKKLGEGGWTVTAVRKAVQSARSSAAAGSAGVVAATSATM